MIPNRAVYVNTFDKKSIGKGIAKKDYFFTNGEKRNALFPSFGIGFVIWKMESAASDTVFCGKAASGSLSMSDGLVKIGKHDCFPIVLSIALPRESKARSCVYAGSSFN